MTIRNQILGQLEARGLTDDERRLWLLIVRDYAHDIDDPRQCLVIALRLVVDMRER
jgi:hypothetical protein